MVVEVGVHEVVDSGADTTTLFSTPLPRRNAFCTAKKSQGANTDENTEVRHGRTDPNANHRDETHTKSATKWSSSTACVVILWKGKCHQSSPSIAFRPFLCISTNGFWQLMVNFLPSRVMRATFWRQLWWRAFSSVLDIHHPWEATRLLPITIHLANMI